MLIARIEREIDVLCSDGRFRPMADAVVEHRLDPYEAAEQLVEQVGAANRSGRWVTSTGKGSTSGETSRTRGKAGRTSGLGKPRQTQKTESAQETQTTESRG